MRKYEDLGLIYTAGRSPGNYRLFDEEALWCVGVIREPARAGPDPGGDPGALGNLPGVAGAGLGHSLIYGDEQLVFLGVLLAALAFEGLWYLRKGTNAIVRTTGGADPRGSVDQ